jgi:histidinol-phosphate aminotransferase
MTSISGVRSLGRNAVRDLPLYAPDAAECSIDLSDSTNLWGPAPAALRAIAAVSGSSVARYPALRSNTLGPALLGYAGLADDPDLRVVTGCGSDDVIDSTMRAFGSPGDRVAFAAPTFSMVPLFARLNGLIPAPVPLTQDFDLDAEQLVDIDAKITYLCAPNNPTATSPSRAAVEYVAAHAQGIVLLDEAYVEFAPEALIALTRRHDRLLVTRTFSKAFGLAGLRVGYGVGAEALVSMIERARGPYKVNALAERAVLASLDDTADGLQWVREHAALAVSVRDRLASSLVELELAPLPSSANFVFVPTPRAPTIARRLRERGILVRLFTELPRDTRRLSDADGAALRIGVGPWSAMTVLLESLREVLR